MNPIRVVNEMKNGKRVMTIRAKASYNGVEQAVKKVIVSTKSIISQESGGQFIPPGGEMFIYLGDDEPIEYRGKKIDDQRPIPPAYARMATEEEILTYTEEHVIPTDFLEIDWNTENPEGVLEDDVFILGSHFSTGDINNIFVNGSLRLKGDVTFNGDVNIYVKDQLIIESSSNIIGETKNTTQGKEYSLKFYVYNNNSAEGFAVSTFNSPSSPISDMKILGNLFIDKGNVSMYFHQNTQLDGHIVYYGSGEVNISSKSNNFTEKIMTGSIYAPFATVNLGIHENKTAVLFGGQIIANSVNVYVNNIEQGNKFYEESTSSRENNPIPVDNTVNFDVLQYGYESYFEK